MGYCKCISLREHAHVVNLTKGIFDEPGKLGARDYFVKPHDLSELVKLIQDLDARWLDSSGQISPAQDLSPNIFPENAPLRSPLNSAG